MKRIKRLFAWLRPVQSSANQKAAEMDLSYFYEALQKTVVILSLPAERQIEAMGAGNVGEELAIDFESYYEDKKDQLIEAGRLNETQICALDELGAAFPSGAEMDEGFWLDQSRLYTDPYWDIIRQKAWAARVAMGLDRMQLKVEINRSESDQDDLVLISIRTRLEPDSPEPDGDRRED